MADMQRLLASPPTNTWLLIGDEASFPTTRELREMRRGWPHRCELWTAPRQAQPGDLLFFYFINPLTAIHFAARAASYPFFDPSIGVNAMRDVDANQWWVEHSPLVELDPVPLGALREMMGGHLILRGKPSHYLRPAVARAILRSGVDRRRISRADAAVLQDPVGSAELPDPARPHLDTWKAIADGVCQLESQVEQYLVEPLLRLSLPQRSTVRWEKAYRLQSGAVPDYVVFEADVPQAVLEVKLGVRVPGDGDWSRSPDFQQVSRYARELDVPAALIDSNRIFLIERGATAPAVMIERHRATVGDLQAIGQHLTGKRPSRSRGDVPPRAAKGKAAVPTSRHPRCSRAGGPRRILLTWNPGPDNDEQWTPEEWRSEIVDPIQSGEVIAGNWSVSNRRHNIEPGDIGYLFRQGQHGRGIVAVGEIQSEPYEDQHWAGAGVTNYVDIDWTHALDLDARLSLDVLEADVPSFSWRKVYSSGREVTPSAAGHHLRQGATNGWQFWLLPDGRKLADLRRDYWQKVGG